ncbi:MAG: hypothetical protein ACLQAT_03835 [Candidatus Binataceae bacterium]
MKFRKKSIAPETKSVKLLLPTDILNRFEQMNTRAEEQGYEHVDLSTIVARLLVRELASAERQLSPTRAMK